MGRPHALHCGCLTVALPGARGERPSPQGCPSALVVIGDEVLVLWAPRPQGPLQPVPSQPRGPIGRPARAGPPFFRMAPTAPSFFSVCFLFIRPSVLLSARYRKTRHYTNVVCCEVLSAEMSKMGRYTNVVCCKLKILHLERNPGPSVAPNSFSGERTAFTLSFLFLFFLTLHCVAPRVGVRDSQSKLCCVAPRVGVRDSQSTLCCVAPRVGVRDSQSKLCCVAPRVGVRDSQSTLCCVAPRVGVRDS